MEIKAHIYTNLAIDFLLKQSPRFSDKIENVKFTFGTNIPRNTDVLIVHRFCEQSIPTCLPKSRTVFIAGEVEEMYPFKREFLNQFGIVSTTYKTILDADVISRQENFCLMWLAGVNYDEFPNFKTFNGHDFFSKLRPVKKYGEIVTVITTIKNHTKLHREREKFLKILKARLGEKVKIFGFNYERLGDKSEALIPYKYHISLENSDSEYAWTEKISDPLLCWAFPFYAGVPSTTIDLPEDAYCAIDITNPEQAVQHIIDQMDSNAWEKAIPPMTIARKKILNHYNTMSLFVRLAKQAMNSEPGQFSKVLKVIKADWMFVTPAKRSKKIKLFLSHMVLNIFPMFQIRYFQLKNSWFVKTMTAPGKRVRVRYRIIFHRIKKFSLR